MTLSHLPKDLIDILIVKIFQMKNAKNMFMNSLKVMGLLFLLTGYSFTSKAIEKKALIVGIGNYGQDAGWNSINGDKDADVVEKSIQSIGFHNSIKIKNSAATKANLLKAFQAMLDSCHPGDVILFYFAGHGQLILDYDADELDGYDESLVLYGAPKKYDALYKNEHHLLDEELSKIINDFRVKLGATGEFIVVIDAGFGWALDKNNGHVMRGGAFPLEERFQTHDHKNIGRFESGILDDQPFSVPSNGHAHLFHLTANTIKNQAVEINGNGVLTLSFTRSLEEMNDSISYEQWFAMIQQFGTTMVDLQNIDAEGETDDIVFVYYNNIKGSDYNSFAVEEVTDSMSAQEMDMLKNIEQYIQEEFNSDTGRGEFRSQ